MTLKIKSSKDTNSSSMRFSMSSFDISVLHSLRSIMYCIRSKAYSFTSSSLSLYVFLMIILRLTILFSGGKAGSGKNLHLSLLLGSMELKKGLKWKGECNSHYFILSSISPIGSTRSPKSTSIHQYNQRQRSIGEA